VEPSRRVALEVPVSAGSASPSLSVPRGAARPPRPGVEPAELVVAAAFLQVRLTQEAPVVSANEEREVGLLFDELLLHLALIDDDLTHCERQGTVCADLHGHPEVRVERRCIVVRRYRNDFVPWYRASQMKCAEGIRV
jgi:hypothetical protein